jgi:hypothetical protein
MNLQLIELVQSAKGYIEPVGPAVTGLTRIREVFRLNFGQDTGSPDWFSSAQVG